MTYHVPTKVLYVRIEPDFHRALRIASAERGITTNALINAGLRHYMSVLAPYEKPRKFARRVPKLEVRDAGAI